MNITGNGKGITLVEVLVSVALVALVVSVVIAAVAQSAVNSKRLDMIYTASELARKRMDDLKALNFRDIPDRAPETNVVIDRYGAADPNGDYRRTTEIDEDWSGNPYATKVKVSVDRIVDGHASGHPVTVETIFADVE